MDWKETYFIEKRVEISSQDSAQKVHIKVWFWLIDIYVYNNSVLLIQFFGIWLSVKYRDFSGLIINNFSQVLHVFISLYKDRLKVQHESATCLLCTIRAALLCCTFYWKLLVTIFNLGIPDISLKTYFIKALNWLVSKSATCAPRL